MANRERSELNRLAHKIAASAAQTIIESVCRPVSPKGWYNIASVSEGRELEDLTDAIQYFELLEQALRDVKERSFRPTRR